MRKRKTGIGIAVVVLVIGALSMALASTGSAKKNGAAGPTWGVNAALSGKQEISAEGKKRAGDPDGYGVFAAVVQQGQLCFALAVAAIENPVAAHIHAAKRNSNGPIVVPLTPVPAGGNPGSSSGCVSADAALLAAIRKHPSRYYANVHTGDFPAGAIRGQLRKAKAR